MRLRTEAAFYVIFAAVFAVPGAYFALFTPEKTDALIFGGIYLAIFLLLRCFEIVVAPDHLEFKMPFTERKVIRYSELDSLSHFRDGNGYRLHVVPKPQSGLSPFSVPSKLFARKDLETLFRAVQLQAPVEDTVFDKAKARNVPKPAPTPVDSIQWLWIVVLIGSVALYFILPETQHTIISIATLSIVVTLGIVRKQWLKRRDLPRAD